MRLTVEVVDEVVDEVDRLRGLNLPVNDVNRVHSVRCQHSQSSQHRQSSQKNRRRQAA